MRASTLFGSGMPVGSVIQAPFTLADPAWKLCDGRSVDRSLYPLLAAQLSGVGTFTGTTRTGKAASSSGVGVIANNGTVWVVAGASGVTGIYTTTNGITYTAQTTPASTIVYCLLWTGVNFIAQATAGVTVPLYSPTGVNWSSASGGANTGNSPTCLAIAPSLGSSGRVCYTAGTQQIYTSDDHGVTYTSRTNATGLVTFGVAWTGTKFIATTTTSGKISTSTDGITWISQSLPFGTVAAASNALYIVSDGAGKVLISKASTTNPDTLGVLISLDHGATWSNKVFAAPTSNTVSNQLGIPSYTNGRFFIAGISSLYVSNDLVSWAIVTDTQVTSGNTLLGDSISYKAGVYLSGGNGGSPISITEDTTKMYMPASMLTYQYISTSNSLSASNASYFVKVQ
jgi:hypothetical protein